ncbi:Flocculin type 3 repeat [Yamadazyma tenuis]|uniref:Flocculin type 3 repeat n=1 Tax=Candida tenuis TaxID=2315449 RepID=UPI0027A97B07|nr:Flocculin type 3 repeat [Yamadazyma tenuis]
MKGSLLSLSLLTILAPVLGDSVVDDSPTSAGSHSSTIPGFFKLSCQSGEPSCTLAAVAPSQFVYSNNTAPVTTSSAPVTTTPVPVTTSTVPVTTSNESKAPETITSIETVTATDVYEVVETVCNHDGECYVTTFYDLFTTYTTTIDGVETVITSAIPYTGTLAADTTTTESQILTEGGDGVATETDISTTVVTITSCSEDKCDTTVATTGLTTVTENETVYTTYCPLSSEDAAATAGEVAANSEAANTDADADAGEDVTQTVIATTVVTITSCSDDKCETAEVTTGLTTVTENETIYTTYCPLSGEAAAAVAEQIKTPESEAEAVAEETKAPESEAAEVAEETKTPESDVTITSTKDKTINVMASNILTQSPAAATTVSQSASVAATSVPPINTYEGSGTVLKTGFVVIALSFVLALI